MHVQEMVLERSILETAARICTRCKEWPEPFRTEPSDRDSGACACFLTRVWLPVSRGGRKKTGGILLMLHCRSELRAEPREDVGKPGKSCNAGMSLGSSAHGWRWGSRSPCNSRAEPCPVQPVRTGDGLFSCLISPVSFFFQSF